MHTSDEGRVPGAARVGASPLLPHNAPESSLAAEPAPEDEQLRLLVMGFATGLTIGGVFLIYIVLETAKLL